MAEKLIPEDISNCISALIARNKLWAGKDIFCYYITNKMAGCFTNSKKSKKYKLIFNNAEKHALQTPECAKSVTSRIFTTEYAGHGKDLANAVLAELIATYQTGNECLIITAGGDGTSLEVQTSLYLAAQSEAKKRDMIMNHITLLRLPLGTGNDGTDGHSIEETIQMLQGPLVFMNARALKIIPNTNPTAAKYTSLKYPAPWYCFNIVSIGLDAYVVYMTNTVKSRLPGNFYHLCVQLSGLVYDKDFPTGNAEVELYDQQGLLTEKLSAPITLIAIGASGYRVYGGGHKVLPTADNVCFTPKVSLARLIRDNHHFVDGSFVGTNLASLHSVEKVVINYDKDILLQADGEVAMLQRENFPLTVEKTEPCIRVICRV